MLFFVLFSIQCYSFFKDFPCTEIRLPAIMSKPPYSVNLRLMAATVFVAMFSMWWRRSNGGESLGEGEGSPWVRWPSAKWTLFRPLRSKWLSLNSKSFPPSQQTFKSRHFPLCPRQPSLSYDCWLVFMTFPIIDHFPTSVNYSCLGHAVLTFRGILIASRGRQWFCITALLCPLSPAFKSFLPIT